MSRARTRVVASAGLSVALVAAVAACSTNTSSGGADGSATFRRPVEMVAPFGPGGGSDQVARAAAAQMESSIDTDVPVVNVPGATGSTGTTKMLSSRPGESMSIMIQDTFTTVPAGAASFSMDELTAVCRLQSMPSALMVRKDKYDDWKDLAADAKSQPGELTVATVGSNSVDDVVLAALEETQDTKFRAVPFSEPSERYAALLGGEVDALYEQLGDVREYLDSGDFVPVILLSKTPVEGYDDVPTAADIGLPEDVVLPQFRGIVVNADTETDVVDALSDACKDAVDSSEMQEFQKQVYADDDSYQNADDFQAFLDEQNELITAQLDKYGMSE
ncbi:tripartite tricarboxylate transporter substrate binding protein [Solicola gregarius]|uniref:Tripartite tricarboxylate transporter substrate binding protein n=1 Tax=Solicola gregarius TaxID=2908642 RepID=A0AA46TE34_9ACTN|nr:tripartite tricarboxylate transporter substrate binding protein [Solicola gregarius]UYM03321.1 tripartite tricarboxylate transporter substrate binding protein [Solicola gregarius]